MTWMWWFLAFLLLAAAATLRAGSASLVRTPRADALHDAAEGDRRAAIVAELLAGRSKLQPAIGLIHSGFLVLTALLFTWLLSDLIRDPWMLAVALIGVALVLLIVTDVLPRTIGRKRPRAIAYRLAWLLRMSAFLGSAATDMVEEADPHPIEVPSGTADARNRDDRNEISLISSVLAFSDTVVREVMVPRTDMVTIEAGSSSDDALDAVLAHGYSRIPVAGDDLDDILGFVYAKDLLRLMDNGSEPVGVTTLMRAAAFVPETKRASDLLRDMQATRSHMAIVTDEFGGTAGIVTIEDLLEELVGEIDDEYDTPEELVTSSKPGELLVDGRLPVEVLSDLIGETLPDDEWDTVGGLVLGLAGRVPHPGEKFEIGEVTIECLRVQGRRVLSVGVRGPGLALSAE